MESLLNYSHNTSNSIFNNSKSNNSNVAGNIPTSSKEYIDTNNFEKVQLQAPTATVFTVAGEREDQRQDNGHLRSLDSSISPWESLASTVHSLSECIMNFENKCHNPWFHNTAAGTKDSNSRTQPPLSPKVKTPALITTGNGGEVVDKELEKLGLAPTIRPAGSWECDDDSEIRMMTIAGVATTYQQDDIYRHNSIGLKHRTSSDSTKSFNLYRSPAWSEDSSLVPSVDEMTDTSGEVENYEDHGDVPPSPTLPPTKKKRDGTTKVSKLFNKLSLSPGPRKQSS